MSDDNAQFLKRGEKDGYFRVQLRVKATELGGRATPIVDGYRSSWAWDDITHDAPLLLEASTQIAPGDEGTVRIYPLHPQAWQQVGPGLALTMLEGSRVIGWGMVLERVPPRA